MRDSWYGDNRDLIKWSVLFRLAGTLKATRILHLAFYRASEFGRLVMDGQEHDIPDEVVAHFRNLRAIAGIDSAVRVTVFDPAFQDRDTHLQGALALLAAFRQERCIVFLDPDTGLESRKPSLDHVLTREAQAIWEVMKVGDVFAFYQHQTNRAGKPWIERKQDQLARALSVGRETIKVATGAKIAQDVAFFYSQKN